MQINELVIPNELHTERLFLRKPIEQDSILINQAILETLDELSIWMPWAKVKPNLSDTQVAWGEFIKQWETRQAFHFLIFEIATSEFIGVCSIPRLDWSVPKFELGYWLKKSSFGHGYMTEAVIELTRFAFNFLQGRRVEIFCDEKNIASKNVAERSGYFLEGVLRNHCLDNKGVPRNTSVYSKIL